MKRNKKGVTRRNRYFIISIIIVLFITMAPVNGKGTGHNLDKLIHFAIFLILSVNLCFKYYKTDKITTAIIWTILFGLITEVIQQFIPGRNMDIYDGIADTFGIIVGYYVYSNLHTRLDKIMLKFGA